MSPTNFDKTKQMKILPIFPRCGH